MRTTAIVLVLILGLFSAGAQATLIVTVPQGTFDVMPVEGTFNDVEPTLELQPWWGDIAFAQGIVDQVRASLGTLGGIGAFAATTSSANFAGGCFWSVNSSRVTCNSGALTGRTEGPWLWLTGSAVIPEPTTLALLGLGIVGLGFRRKAA